VNDNDRGISFILLRKLITKKYIWFDLGYTLLYLKIDKPMKQVLNNHGFNFSLDRIRKTFHLADKYFMRERPGILGKRRSSYMPRYIGKFLDILNITVDMDTFTSEWMEHFQPSIEMWEPFPCVKNVLETLSHSSFRTGIISNWDSSARPILEKHGLTEMFDTIVVSSEVGMEKPGKDIFLHALSQAGVTPEDSLYVGDNYYDDTIGARNVGMDSVIINRFGTLGVEELTDAVIVPDIRFLLQAAECGKCK